MKKRTRKLATRLIGAMNKLSTEHKYLLEGTLTEVINNIPTIIVGICNDCPENENADTDYNDALESLLFIENKLGITAP